MIFLVFQTNRFPSFKKEPNIFLKYVVMFLYRFQFNSSRRSPYFQCLVKEGPSFIFQYVILYIMEVF